LNNFSVIQKSAANLTLAAISVRRQRYRRKQHSSIFRAAENPEDELRCWLTSQLAIAPLEKLGFPVDPEPKLIIINARERKKFYQIRLPEGFIAILYVGNKILEDASNYKDVTWFPYYFQRDGASGIYVFSDSSYVDGSFNQFAETAKKFGPIKEVRFLAAYVIAKLKSSPDLVSRVIAIQEELEIDSIFALASSKPEAAMSITELRNNQGQVQELVKIVMGRLANPVPGTTTKAYIRYLVLKTKLPIDLKGEYGSEDVWSGNPDVDAQNLIHKLIQLNQAIGEDEEGHGPGCLLRRCWTILRQRAQVYSEDHCRLPVMNHLK
jgi:hypothetical protein